MVCRDVDHCIKKIDNIWDYNVNLHIFILLLRKLKYIIYNYVYIVVFPSLPNRVDNSILCLLVISSALFCMCFRLNFGLLFA